MRLAILNLVGVLILAAAPLSAAGEKPIVSVWLMESRGTGLKGDEMVGLTDYMSGKLGETGSLEVVSRKHLGVRMKRARAEGGTVYVVRTAVSKVGTMCLLTARLISAGDQVARFGAIGRYPCDPGELIEGVEDVAAKFRKALGPDGGLAGENVPLVVVELVESRKTPLKETEVVAMSDYLATALAGSGAARVAPSADAQGKGAGDKFRVEAKIARVGRRCLCSATLRNVGTETEVAGVTIKSRCAPTDLVDALHAMVTKLKDKLKGLSR